MVDEAYHLSLAAELAARGLRGAALDLVTSLLVRAPASYPAWEVKAQATKALSDYARAARTAPSCAPGLNNYGMALQESGQGAEACAPLSHAAALAPELAAIWSNLAGARMGAGFPQNGARLAHRALIIAPEDPAAQYNLGMCRLMMADALGFAGHEKRFEAGAVQRPTISGPRWRGEDRPQAVLFVHAEQGLGDTLLFSRFVAPARRRVGKIILAVQPQLLRALSGVADDVVSVLAAPPLFDFQVPLMSLPLILGADLLAPPPPPAIRFESSLAERYARRLSAYPGLKAGLVWQGNPHFKGDATRSIPLEMLAPLGALSGITWISLQTGADRARPGAGPPLIDWMDEIADVADTAALITQLDLVVAVDSMLCHLTGALGRPVWIMNRFNTCWRWFLEREDSPWYPSVRLFRQSRPGHWDDVIDRVLRAAQSVNAGLTHATQ